MVKEGAKERQKVSASLLEFEKVGLETHRTGRRGP